jgi:hypothetical protein
VIVEMFEVDEAGLKSGRRRGYIAGEGKNDIERVCLFAEYGGSDCSCLLVAARRL